MTAQYAEVASLLQQHREAIQETRRKNQNTTEEMTLRKNALGCVLAMRFLKAEHQRLSA